MIDIHSHILPGCDDGSPDLETSLAMVRMAAAAGTTDIVATPHADLEFRFDPQATARKIDELRRAAGPSPRIFAGCDFHLTPESIEDAVAHPDRYTINHKSYLLVEFAEFFIPRTTEAILGGLAAAGIVPVVTHPERNPVLRDTPETLRRWLDAGCLVQVTAQSFLGRFGRRARDAAEDLMSRGMVHFVASDAHNTEDRPPVLDQARSHIASRYGEERAQLVFSLNPAAALGGEPLPPQPSGRRRKWLFF